MKYERILEREKDTYGNTFMILKQNWFSLMVEILCIKSNV